MVITDGLNLTRAQLRGAAFLNRARQSLPARERSRRDASDIVTGFKPPQKSLTPLPDGTASGLPTSALPIVDERYFMESIASKDPREHTANIRKEFRELIEHLREDTGKVEEP